VERNPKNELDLYIISKLFKRLFSATRSKKFICICGVSAFVVPAVGDATNGSDPPPELPPDDGMLVLGPLQKLHPDDAAIAGADTMPCAPTISATAAALRRHCGGTAHQLLAHEFLDYHNFPLARSFC
tara:strand:+ start:78 stop:461 length:384 start_codon:yes stop_codon:yes gene_type:complete